MARAVNGYGRCWAQATGRRFLDNGGGSGLFGLAAYRLDVTVYSYDYFPIGKLHPGTQEPCPRDRMQ